MTQYVRCTFKRGGRSYTYHNDGEPVKVGDKVEVEGRDGKSKVNVEGISDQKPSFLTKAIIRVIPPPDESLIDDAGKPPQKGLL